MHRTLNPGSGVRHPGGSPYPPFGGCAAGTGCRPVSCTGTRRFDSCRCDKKEGKLPGGSPHPLFLCEYRLVVQDFCLPSRQPGFESRYSLSFPASSKAERHTVNVHVAGSSPALGATPPRGRGVGVPGSVRYGHPVEARENSVRAGEERLFCCLRGPTDYDTGPQGRGSRFDSSRGRAHPHQSVCGWGERLAEWLRRQVATLITPVRFRDRSLWFRSITVNAPTCRVG